MANEKQVLTNCQRLIDANDAVRMLRGKCIAKYPSTFSMGLLASADEISKMPPLDAVEVVRCKDCKHYSNGWLCNLYLNVSHEMKPDDFCSYGERREGD